MDNDNEDFICICSMGLKYSTVIIFELILF